MTINHNINVNNFGGSVFVGGATANSSTFNSAILLAKSVFLTSAPGGVANFNGMITGVGGITVSGSGTVNLGGANGYLGSTHVTGGSLIPGLQ